MRRESEVREELARREAWLDEHEGDGSREEPVETGIVEALQWVLGIRTGSYLFEEQG